MKKVTWVFGLFILIGMVSTSNASIIIDVNQINSNVVATGSGTIDLSGISTTTNTYNPSGVNPGFGAILLGPAIFTTLPVYFGINGPTFGSFVTTYASSGSGDMFGLNVQSLVVPVGYISGDQLSGSATWLNQTFDSLRMTPGTYKYTWGSGPTADYGILNIGVAPVPAPSTILLLGPALAGLALWRRKHS